ncbi:MAG: asparagine synthase [Parcubacteria group bacterium Greene0416_79]|nr:MAG: asparagine synthase [Parcubacteria group bacterium Greene0416_79]
MILAAFEKWGTACFDTLSGIFALALWDSKEETLFLARDRIGIKPLYYSFQSPRLRFASEIKALLECSDSSRSINRLAFDCFLRVNYVPAPLTIFADIRKLLPGHMLTYKNGAVQISKYAREVTPAVSGDSFAYRARELRARIHASVKEELVSDRPVGLYLSGGIDSSAVLEAMTSAKGTVETFSVGFRLARGEQPDKFNADFLLARNTAKYFGATHHEVLVSPDEILPLFEEALFHLDEPISNATIIPMIKLSRFAKERVTVVLGGDGGDELFSGYERYRYSLLSSYYRRVPEVLRTGLNGVFPVMKKLITAPGIERYAQFHFLKEDVLKPILTPYAYHEHAPRDFFRERFFSKDADLRGYGSTRMNTDKREPFEEIFMMVDRQSWLPDESLLRSDKLGMAGGVEARVPLLNRRVVDFADSLPLRFKVSPFRTKIILKEAFRGYIPDELLHQPKRGWFSPGAKWLRYPHIASFAREVLSPDYCAATKDLFEWKTVRARLEAHLRGEYHFTELWAILTFQVWARIFKITA